MKILLTVDPELPVPPDLYGGIERIVEGLVTGYIEAGHDVVLCANKNSRVPCRLIGWPGFRSQYWPDTLKNAFVLTRLVYKEDFDIIHSFSRLAYMTALFPTRIPKIMSYQREPSITQIKKAVKLAHKGSLAFTGCSEYITDKIKKVAEAYTVYNFAPIDQYTAEAVIAEDAPLVFLGRVEEIKGPDIAIEVAKKSGRKLIIAGNIPDNGESWFNKKISPHLNDRITYIGPVNNSQKNELLGKALGLLMPIQWNEPFGIVMAEAMACGTPVLGFPFGSIPEIVQNNINGFLCGDTTEMIAKVQNLAEIDRLKVRQIAEQKFSDKRILSNYIALYENHLNRRNKL